MGTATLWTYRAACGGARLPRPRLVSSRRLPEPPSRDHTPRSPGSLLVSPTPPPIDAEGTAVARTTIRTISVPPCVCRCARVLRSTKARPTKRESKTLSCSHPRGLRRTLRRSKTTLSRVLRQRRSSDTLTRSRCSGEHPTPIPKRAARDAGEAAAAPQDLRRTGTDRRISRPIVQGHPAPHRFP